MKNLVKMIGFIVIMATIGFSMAACKAEAEVWEIPPLPEAKGKLTITLMPKEYVGKYIYAMLDLDNKNIPLLYGMNNRSGSDVENTIIHLVKIESTPAGGYGEVEIPLYYFDKSTYEYVPYEGNDVLSSVSAYIHNDASVPRELAYKSSTAWHKGTVTDPFSYLEGTFKNGSQSLYW
jgi:hypothetical protein